MLFYMTLIEGEAEQTFFGVLYQRYKQEMFFSARDILGDDKDAEDAVHEAFLSALPYLGRLPTDPDHPKTRNFLLTLVDSKAIDIYRRRRRRAWLPWNAAFDENAVYPHNDPVLEGTAIARAIANLPFTDRQLLLLRFDMGFTTKEIAKMLGNPELLTRLYNLIPTLAILLATLHIFLAYFLWRAE